MDKTALKDKLKNILARLNLRKVLVFVFSAVFVVSAALLAVRLVGYYRDRMTYKNIAGQIPSENPENYFNKAENAPPAQTQAPASDNSDVVPVNSAAPVVLPYSVMSGNPAELGESGILRDYAKLKAENSDLFGWIKVSGFKKPLSYPVMYTSDESYYLKKDFYKNDSYAGSIFFDSRNDPAQVDRHIILYGHAMKDMAMFGFFADFPQNAESLKNVSKIYLDLLNTRLEYEIFSTYFAKADDPYRQTDFSSDDEYVRFLEEIKNKSAYNFGNISFTPNDRILTLSTCSDTYENGRTVVHARLSRVIQYGQGSENGLYSEFGPSGQTQLVSANVYLSSLSVYYATTPSPSPSPTPAASPTPEATPPPAASSPAEASPIAPSPSDASTTTAASPTPAASSSPAASPLPVESSAPPKTPSPSPKQPDPLGKPTPTYLPSPPPGMEAQPVFPCKLNPAFNPGMKECKTTVPENADKVIIVMALSDPKAIAEIYMNDVKLASNAIPLKDGDNIIKIRVISRDRQYARYITLTVTRTPPAAPSSSESPKPSPANSPEASPANSPGPSPTNSPKPKSTPGGTAVPSPAPGASATATPASLPTP